MPIPLLEYKPTTQNQRVRSFGVAELNEDAPYIYRLEDVDSFTGIQELIWAAYRQVFSEHEILKANRQLALESQLKNRSITVRDFIRGLAKSQRFYEEVVSVNNNYRLVDVCLKRLLGRAAYNKDEEISWSIKIATLGFSGFVDALVDSQEYTEAFGDTTVPYQRKRMEGRPFNLVTPRYGEDWRDKLESQRYKWGDVNNFLEMARNLKPKAVIPQPVQTANIKIPDMTRDNKGQGIPVSVNPSASFPTRL
jgi:phycobilisome rod-core linker protein